MYKSAMNRNPRDRIASLTGCLVLLATVPSCRGQSDADAAAEVRAVAAQPRQTAGSSWPRFLGPQFNGSAVVTRQFDFAQEPAFVWSIPLGDGYGMGSVADGRYLQLDAEPAEAAGRRERLRCFDLATARLQWSASDAVSYRDLFGYEDGPRASPTIADGVVYTLGVAGLLNARQLDDGSLLWSVDTNQQYGVVQNFFGVASSPLIYGDQVLVMIGGSPPADQSIPPARLDRVSANGSVLVSFDAKTGAERWRCGDDLASYSSPMLAELDGRPVVLVFARGGLWAIDPAVGEVLWRYDHRASVLESVNAMVPVVAGEYVFISECYEVGSVLLRVTAEGAETVWKDPSRNRRLQSMRCHWSTPVLVDGFLYGCSGRNAPDSDFRCIDFRTGQVRWQDDRRIRSSVTRLGDHLLVMEERGLLQVLKADPQQLQVVAEWDLAEASGERPPLQYPCWSAPIVIDDKLLVRGTERVLCLQWASAPLPAP